MIEDGLVTNTSTEQHALEQKVAKLYCDLEGTPLTDSSPALRLLREEHIEYLHEGLGELPAGYASLDAGRPWICFWIIHSLSLLNAPWPARPARRDVINFLKSCQAASGGFGGGPLQLPHLAPTYAATAALVSLGGNEALDAVDRPAMLDFICRMAVPPERGGGFQVCQGGEVDCRGCYTAMATLRLLKMDPAAVVARAGMVDFIRRCQTYEGGLGGEPGNEAHGGYTFCGLAALMLVGKASALNLPSLLHWAVHCQGQMEGGFMGRTNKLVDGCYSFWQGGLFPLLQRLWPEYLAQTKIPGLPVSSIGLQLVPSLLLQAHGPLEAAQTEVARLQSPQEKWQASAEAQHGTATGDEAAASSRPQLQAAEAAHDSVTHRAQQRAAEHLQAVKVGAAMLCSHSGSSEPPPERTQSSAGPESRESSSESEQARTTPPEKRLVGPLYNTAALRLWLLRCCQSQRGGFRDKPGKPVDYYHTCYCLSGLASCQELSGGVDEENRLEAIDPLCNVVAHRLEHALAYYASPSTTRKISPEGSRD